MYTHDPRPSPTAVPSHSLLMLLPKPWPLHLKLPLARSHPGAPLRYSADHSGENKAADVVVSSVMERSFSFPSTVNSTVGASCTVSPSERSPKAALSGGADVATARPSRLRIRLATCNATIAEAVSRRRRPEILPPLLRHLVPLWTFCVPRRWCLIVICGELLFALRRPDTKRSDARWRARSSGGTEGVGNKEED